ncbi:hypothetical protein VH570_06495 [Sphingobium sp. HT1-2]|jgi:hypothetical protein|uniref:hypothetical protein n=1 Tax=Sphingobium sp. HT1-2 TaxID=3111640 RepID=UPI003C04D729
MAITNTKILDLVPNEKILGQTINALMAEKHELITSGLAARGPEVDAVASGGPRKASIPYLNPLSTDKVNVSTDDLTVAGDVGKMTADEFTVLRHDLNYSWATADLTRMVTQFNVQGGISAGIAAYWNGIVSKIAALSLKGALAADADLTFGAVDDEFSLAQVALAAATAGVYADQFDTLIVSPLRKAKMIAANESAFVAKSDTKADFDTWAGKKLIVSNVFGDETSILARSGALALGYGTVAVPTEIERVANGANGGGGDILHSRISPVVHVQGFDYLGAVAPAITPATGTSVLGDAASWGRKVPLEMIGFRAIRHAA